METKQIVLEITKQDGNQGWDIKDKDGIVIVYNWISPSLDNAEDVSKVARADETKFDTPYGVIGEALVLRDKGFSDETIVEILKLAKG